MIDKEQVSRMIKDAEKYIIDLESMHVETKKDLEEKERYYAVSMAIFAAVNRAIDIGTEVVSGSEGLPQLNTYRETFDVLASHKIIGSSTARKMTELAKYRNIITHQYHTLSSEELFRLRKQVFHIRDFIAEIKAHLAKR